MQIDTFQNVEFLPKNYFCNYELNLKKNVSYGMDIYRANGMKNEDEISLYVSLAN